MINGRTERGFGGGRREACQEAVALPLWLTDRSSLSQTYLLRRREEGDLERGETVATDRNRALQRSSVGLANREKTFSGWRYLPLVNSRSLGERERRKQRSPQKGGGASEVVFGGKKDLARGGNGNSSIGRGRPRRRREQERRKEGGGRGESRTASCGPTVSERMMRGREGGGRN